MRIEFHDDAETDLQEALRYYGEISWRVVSEFEAEIQGELAKIRRNPRHFHFTKDKAFRRSTCTSFLIGYFTTLMRNRVSFVLW